MKFVMLDGTDVASLTPEAVAAYYRFPEATGRGQRIALIELGGGYHVEDLDTYFARLDPRPVVTPVPVEFKADGLPLVGTNSPLDVSNIGTILDALGEPGATFASMADRFEPGGKLWSEFLYTFEVTIDIEIAGAIAPGAAIDVYFASLAADGLSAAIVQAVAGDPTVISISWGGAESWWLGEGGRGRAAVERIDQAIAFARSHDITVCCSSGDWGAVGAATSPGGLTRANFPASSPHALACGGTSLRFGGNQIVGESVWNTTVFGTPRASGGGMSGLFPRPDHQRGVATPIAAGAWLDSGKAADFDGRWLPDVAAHADGTVGYSVLLGGRPFVADGTSAVCPVWAALLARVSEKIGRKVGWINERLYQAAGSASRDVDQGNNGLPGSPYSFTAGIGWDPCTGWGSPDGERLVRLLSTNPPAPR